MDAKLIEDMHRSMGLPPPNENSGRGGGQMNDDMIEEDIPEDFWVKIMKWDYKCITKQA